MANLTDAMAAAHTAGVPLGLDNKSRIRINAEGDAVLAFPVVLPESTRERDTASIAAALEMLIDTTTTPTDVTALREQTHTVNAEDPAALHALADALRSCGLHTEDEEPAQIHVAKERTPRPDKQS